MAKLWLSRVVVTQVVLEGGQLIADVWGSDSRVLDLDEAQWFASEHPELLGDGVPEYMQTMKEINARMAEEAFQAMLDSLN